MHAEYAATFGGSKVTHAIRGEWSYSAISDAMTVCGRKGPFSTRHNMNSDVEITCKTCMRLSPEPVTEPETFTPPKLTSIMPVKGTGKPKSTLNARQRRAMRNGATRYNVNRIAV